MSEYMIMTVTTSLECPLSPLQTFTYSPSGDLFATHTYTNGTDDIVESYAYDMLGNRIATTDALGNTTHRTYDPFGRILSEWGATYPVRYTYDTQGRRTSLTTFRTTGGSRSRATETAADAQERVPPRTPEKAALHKIARTAQAILDARTRYPESSLADLYDPITKPSDLRAAHTSNDKTVLAAYGLAPDTPEPEIVAHLFKLSAEKTSADRDSYPLSPDAGVASFNYEVEMMNKIR